MEADSELIKRQLKGNEELYIFVHRQLVSLFSSFFEDRVTSLRSEMGQPCRAFSVESLTVAASTFVEEDGVDYDLSDHDLPHWWDALLNECQVEHDLSRPFPIDYVRPNQPLMRLFCKRLISLDTRETEGEWRDQMPSEEDEDDYIEYPLWTQYTMEDVLTLTMSQFYQWFHSAITEGLIPVSFSCTHLRYRH